MSKLTAPEASMPVLLSGNDSIVRVMLEQHRRDRAAGFKTAGFISGYRGSPLGTLDMSLWAAEDQLKASDIHFTPGVNEDLAATAVWGTQYVSRQAGAFEGAKFDGVFALWYGKGPGVDRSGDALKHGNLAGSSPIGGALVLAGDDHAAKSSTTAHQSDPALIAAGIPILYPASVQDILHLGLHGLAMSRFSGAWVALKLVTDVVETSATVDAATAGPQSHMTGTTERACRVQDQPRQAEERLMREKLPAALQYARQHGLNRVTHSASQARTGLVSAGKSYADLMQALDMLELDKASCEALGLRILKMDMVWPLDSEAVKDFAAGLDRILVVEEKRAILEDQIKSSLFGTGTASPTVSVEGKNLFPSWGELSPHLVASVLHSWLELKTAPPASAPGALMQAIAAPRLPSFCSGCPHSTSTRVPDGSRALAGIGCHGMATIRQVGVTTTMSQMGGEGAMWIGQAPFMETPHVFANLGDGTYFHSGLLAIRAAVAAKVRMTYKILVNGFVSMTGGQPIDGEVSVEKMIQSLQAEGVGRIVVVTDDPEKYEGSKLPGNTPVHHRRDLDLVQQQLRETDGVTALIYEQPCATERRRLRKRGTWPDPAVRTFIHPEVCEGCGDCGKASDCLSVEPLDTPFGRKRRINQSSCNKDRTCVDGFCPSFVTVHGGKFIGKSQSAGAKEVHSVQLPAPDIAGIATAFNVLFAGVGGTGVVTASAVLAKAAQIAGLEVSVLDVTGLSQKYGGVQSHLRMAPAGASLSASRIAQGQVDVLIGCDMLVSAEVDVVTRLRQASAKAVINTALSPAADFTRNPDWQINQTTVMEHIQAACKDTFAMNATERAEITLGDAIGANLMLLGMAWQRGWIPVPLAAIQEAIQGQTGAQFNQAAFELGRRTAEESQQAPREQVMQWLPREKRNLDDWIELHTARLTAYQNDKLAHKYAARIARIAKAESEAGFNDQVSQAAARGYFKLLAHKDEFEVARLLCDSKFRADLQSQFDGPVEFHAHLGGGALAKTDPVTGKPLKRELKGWIWPALTVLAGLRPLRGTILDPWRNGEERKLAQHWLQQYEADLDRIEHILQNRCTAQNHANLHELASTPDRIRGFGHVRAANASLAQAKREQILQAIAVQN